MALVPFTPTRLVCFLTLEEEPGVDRVAFFGVAGPAGRKRTRLGDIRAFEACGVIKAVPADVGLLRHVLKDVDHKVDVALR